MSIWNILDSILISDFFFRNFYFWQADPRAKSPSLEHFRNLLEEKLRHKLVLEQGIVKSVFEARNISKQRHEEEKNVRLDSEMFQFDHMETLLRLMKEVRKRTKNA